MSRSPLSYNNFFSLYILLCQIYLIFTPNYMYYIKVTVLDWCTVWGSLMYIFFPKCQVLIGSTSWYLFFCTLIIWIFCFLQMQHFSTFGGAFPKDTTKGILHRILTNSVFCSINWTWKRGICTDQDKPC